MPTSPGTDRPLLRLAPPASAPPPSRTARPDAHTRPALPLSLAAATPPLSLPHLLSLGVPACSQRILLAPPPPPSSGLLSDSRSLLPDYGCTSSAVPPPLPSAACRPSTPASGSPASPPMSAPHQTPCAPVPLSHPQLSSPRARGPSASRLAPALPPASPPSTSAAPPAPRPATTPAATLH